MDLANDHFRLSRDSANEPNSFGKPRVMLFTDSFVHGGTERQFVQVLRQLDPRKYELLVGCLHKRGPFLSDVRSLGVPIVEFPIRSLYGFDTARRFWQLVVFLRRNRIAILHAFDFYTDVLAIPAARLAGVPVVLATRRELLDLRSLRQQHAVRIGCWLATGIVANSHAAVTYLRRHANEKTSKVTIIPNGIDLENFRSTVSATQIRKQLGLSDDSPLVGVLAALRPEKDVETFLRAAAHVGAELPDARFLVIGDGSERHRLEQVAANLGLASRVLFLGDQSTVENLLPALDVFVQSSLTESMPNAVLEAMAMGRPVVATKAGGTQELVLDGETGYLVPIRNPKIMAERILELLRDSERSRWMGEAGRSRVEQAFSCTRMKNQLETLYDSMLRKHRPTARILQIGNYPPPVCGWSIHTQSVQSALTQRGADARVLDIGPGHHLRKPNCISVRDAFDYVVKLVTYRLRGFRFQPHVNGDSWKGYALAMAAVLTGRLTGKPAVLMFHAGPNQSFFPRRRGFWFHAFRLLFRASGEVICNSEPVRQVILNYGIAAERIHPIFSVDYITEKVPVPLPVAVEHFLQTHQPRLFCYAMFRPEFTMGALFEAFAALRREYPRVGLVIGGPMQVPKDAEEQIRGLGVESSILVAGNLPHAQFLSAIKNSDVFIRTHLRDGRCASVIEALTLGVPVVAADDCMRPRSVVTYKPGDAADLELKLSIVLSDIERFQMQTRPPNIEGLDNEISLLTSA